LPQRRRVRSPRRRQPAGGQQRADHIPRARAAGKNDTEIRRSLKRYIAREIFRTLESTPAA
jgi:hypothetical protein